MQRRTVPLAAIVADLIQMAGSAVAVVAIAIAIIRGGPTPLMFWLLAGGFLSIVIVDIVADVLLMAPMAIRADRADAEVPNPGVK